MNRVPRNILRGTFKVLVLLAAFHLFELTTFGLREELYGTRHGQAEAASRSPAIEATSRWERVLAEEASGLASARKEYASIVERLRADRDAVKDLLDQRATELEGSLLGRLEEERMQLQSASFALERDASRLEKLTASLRRDPDRMKRLMVRPTVQLKGNGTVGSGVLIYSEEQSPHGDGGEKVHTTLVLTAYHVVLEVMGDKADRGIVEEVHLLEDDSGAMEVIPAKLVLFDRAKDIALLRLNSTRKFENVVDLTPSSELENVDVFSRAYAVGCPLGNRPLPTLGEISSKNKVVGDQVFWMLSAPTFFGNSGGGVYLADTYRLVGISSMIYTYGKMNPTVVPHMGLFVPLETIYRWLDGEGYSFVHERKPVPRVMLWKLVHSEKASPSPRTASSPIE